MPIASKNTIHTLQEFWMSLSGWDDIKKFGSLFFFILRKPISHTIQVFKNIEARDSFKFFVQSFVIFTIITSLFTAFRGNDILKNILQILNQIFFLTLATLLYFLIFNRISKIKRSFTDFLVLYSLYMGFILPFFAIGVYLNWQLLLIGQDPTPGSIGSHPFKFILTFLGDFIFNGFGIYYSYRIIRYFWNIHFGLIFLGMGLVFALLAPVQFLWIKWQCKLGITPEFEFNSMEHRKATYEILGCEDISCKKCLLIGEWKLTDKSIQKLSKEIYDREFFEKKFLANIDNAAVDKEIKLAKSSHFYFEEDRFTLLTKIDSSGYVPQYNTFWFISDNGENIFFNYHGYQLIKLEKDSLIVSIEKIFRNSYIYMDTISYEFVKNKDRYIPEVIKRKLF